MKIRQQKIDGLETIWRINENVCGTYLRDKFSMFALGRFQGAYYGCANSYDSPAVINHGGGRNRNRKVFRVHSMLRHIFGSHGQKCSSSHVQRYEGMRNFAQNLRGEMKTGSR